MRIWLLAENWPPRRGGIENYLTHIAEQLTNAGHEVIVIAPHTHRFFWPIVKPAWLPLFISLWRLAKRERPDVILCGKGLFEGLLGYYFHKHLNIPYVVFTYAMEIAVWSQTRNTWRKLERVLRDAYRVVCINDETKNKLQEAGAESERIVKITPGVNERFLRAVAPSLVESTARHFGVRQPYILSLGRLIERKGFDTLIEAFSKLDQTTHATLKLVIVGEGPDQARLEKIVADNYMQTSVIFLGAVEDKYLPALYAGAQVFALLPRDIAGDTEGFGIVYLEAGAMSISVLATRSGGVVEAVIDGTTGLLVAPGDVAAAAAALTTLLSDGDRRARFGRAARQRIEAEFRWEARQKALNSLVNLGI